MQQHVLRRAERGNGQELGRTDARLFPLQSEISESNYAHGAAQECHGANGVVYRYGARPRIAARPVDVAATTSLRAKPRAIATRVSRQLTERHPGGRRSAPSRLV